MIFKNEKNEKERNEKKKERIDIFSSLYNEALIPNTEITNNLKSRSFIFVIYKIYSTVNLSINILFRFPLIKFSRK